MRSEIVTAFVDYRQGLKISISLLLEKRHTKINYYDVYLGIHGL